MEEGVQNDTPVVAEKGSVKETTADILERNTHFNWEHPQQDWAGMDRSRLKSLVGEVGELLGISAEQASGIETIFGDHIAVEYPNGDKHLNTALCLVDYDEGDSVKKCRVILNRSYELADYASAGGSTGSQRNKKNTEGISCKFEEPFENVVWLLAEELKHAQIWAMARDKSTEAKWREKYKRIMAVKGVLSDDDYVTDIQEVTASRNALRVLKKLVPERADYYDRLYKQSLEEGKNVTPSIGKVMDKTYIKTGFKTPVS